MTFQTDPQSPNAPPPQLGAEALSQTYRRALMRFFLRHTNDRAEAEDLTQEVFLRTLRMEAPALEAPDAFLFTIASNLLRDRARRRITRQAHRHVSLDAPASPDGEDGPPQIAAEGLSAERVLMDRQRLQQVLAALDELPERTRDIFVLFRLERMRQSDIAARMGISVSAVEKHVVRAVAHLARRFR